jgi:hypothetical protein
MENNEVIPFMGDVSVSNDTGPGSLAGWVREQDKIPLLLALSLYSTPRKELGDFVLVPNSYKVRYAVWYNQRDGMAIVGLRGTAATAAQGASDIKDDQIIAFGSNYCNLSLVTQVQETLFQLVGQIKSVVFVGHSLGGTAAFCLTSQIQNSRGIGFNSGAAPTNPILSGPGSRFTHYHIFGDLISSHMAPWAADVVIIKKGNAFSLVGTSQAHSSSNILESSGSWYFSNQTEEDRAYEKWGKTYQSSYINNVWGKLMSFLYFLQTRSAVEKNPIPGSERWNRRQ